MASKIAAGDVVMCKGFMVCVRWIDYAAGSAVVEFKGRQSIVNISQLWKEEV